jgi:hypothetical protein
MTRAGDSPVCRQRAKRSLVQIIGFDLPRCRADETPASPSASVVARRLPVREVWYGILRSRYRE